MKLTELKPLHNPNPEHTTDHLIEYAMRFLRNEITLVDEILERHLGSTEEDKESFEWTCDKVIEYGVFDDRVDWTPAEIKWLMMACESGIEMMKHLIKSFDLERCALQMPYHSHRYGGWQVARTQATGNYQYAWNDFLGKKDLLNPDGVLGTHASLQLAMLLFKQTLLQGEKDWGAWTKPVWVNNVLMQMAKTEPEKAPF